MRTLLSLAAAGLLMAQPVGSPEFSQKLVRFNHEYNEFFRDYFGCPKRAIDISECDPRVGRTNYGAYQRAQRLAQGVFPK